MIVRELKRLLKQAPEDALVVFDLNNNGAFEFDTRVRCAIWRRATEMSQDFLKSIGVDRSCGGGVVILDIDQSQKRAPVTNPHLQS